METTDQLIGQTLAGKYRIEERFRDDGTTRTYRAAHVLMGKRITLKVLNPSLSSDDKIVARFQQEARTLSKISSPHILNVLDFGTDERGLVYLVLENIEGKDVRQLSRELAPLSLARAASIMRQVAEAVDNAHEQGIVHGDLSSDKILSIENNNGLENIKIIGFGASDFQELNDFAVIKSNPFAAMPFYKSPEQCGEKDETTPQSDIYALGAILYEMLTQTVPFNGEEAHVIRSKHVQEIPPSLLARRQDVPAMTEQIIQRALAKNPAQRFQNAKDMADALEQAVLAANTQISNEETIVRPRGLEATAMAATARPISADANNDNSRWKAGFFVLLGITLLSAVLFYFTQTNRMNPATMASDPNAMPSQPLSPATGATEAMTSNPNAYPQVPNGTSFDPSMPITLGNGAPGSGGTFPSGGSNPYGGGGYTPIPPGQMMPGTTGPGGRVVIPPNNDSPFVNDNTTIIANVPIQNANRTANANVNANKNQNANVKPNANTAPTRPTNANVSPTPPTATATPTPKAAPTPTPNAPRTQRIITPKTNGDTTPKMTTTPNP